MLISSYLKDLSQILKLDEFNDVSLNGVQIGGEDREIKKVAFAVDAALLTIKRAVKEKADVLVVHHGLFWGTPLRITGSHYARVKEAILGSLFLFASHLPLDAHREFGHNAEIARLVGLKDKNPFGFYKGQYIGFSGELEKELSKDEVISRLGFSSNSVVLNDRNKKFKTVAIVSGGGAGEIEEAIEKNIDLFITGEVGHENFYTVNESNLTVLAGGHYKSETFGLKALERYTRTKYNLETVFIDAETGF